MLQKVPNYSVCAALSVAWRGFLFFENCCWINGSFFFGAGPGARHAGHIELGRGCCPTAHIVLLAWRVLVSAAAAAAARVRPPRPRNWNDATKNQKKTTGAGCWSLWWARSRRCQRT